MFLFSFPLRRRYERIIHASETEHHGGSLGAAAVLGLSAQSGLAQAAPPPGGGPPAPPPGGQWVAPQTVQISGTVQGFNYAPRGEVEGLMIKTADRVVQINLPRDLGPIIASKAAVGSQVQLSAIPQMGMPDHPVYDFYSMKSGDREIRMPSPADEKFVHVEATVKQLNYARHGEVNGAVLDSGDFVHFGPDAAGALNLQPGMKLTLDGVARPMLTGPHQSIEAVAVNGQMLQRRPRPGDQGPPPRGPRHPGGPRGPRHGPPGPDGPDGAGAPNPPAPPPAGPEAAPPPAP